VWFVRQLVPSRLIAAVGRLRYDEPFWPMRIRRRAVDTLTDRRVDYAVGPDALGWHVSVTGSPVAHVPPAGSPEDFFTARVLACRARPNGGLGVFRVVHPAWAVRDVRAVDYRLDFGSLYGSDWDFLNRARPVAVAFADGSEVTVSPPQTVSG
jgi:hypothetical protein